MRTGELSVPSTSTTITSALCPRSLAMSSSLIGLGRASLDVGFNNEDINSSLGKRYRGIENFCRQAHGESERLDYKWNKEGTFRIVEQTQPEGKMIDMTPLSPILYVKGTFTWLKVDCMRSTRSS
jgi:hypothetical protein